MREAVKPTILLIDNDLAFIFWLGQALDKSGCEAFPAKSVPDAIKLADELHLSIDLLIVNCSLLDSADLISSLRQRWGYVKIIGLAAEEDTPISPEVEWRCCKPEAIDKIAKAEFLLQIHQILGLAPDLGTEIVARRTIV